MRIVLPEISSPLLQFLTPFLAPALPLSPAPCLCLVRRLRLPGPGGCGGVVSAAGGLGLSVPGSDVLIASSGPGRSLSFC